MFFYKGIIAKALLKNGNGNRPLECSKELTSTLLSDAAGLQNRIKTSKTLKLHSGNLDYGPVIVRPTFFYL